MYQNMNTITEADQATDTRIYPIKTLKIFGGVQIGLGLLIGVLSIAGIVFDGVNMGTDCSWDSYSYDYSYYYRRCDKVWDAPLLLGFDITCLIFSGWCILNGLFPFCMNEKRRNNWRCLKITFMVCSIVGSAFFLPTIFSLGVSGAIIRSLDSGGVAAVPAFVAILAMAEMVISIIAASYCCCCSSWESSNQTRTVYITQTQPGPVMQPATQQGMILSMPNSQIPIQQLPNPQTTNQQISNPQGQVQTATIQTGYYPVGMTTYQYQQASAAQNETANDNNPPPYKQ